MDRTTLLCAEKWAEAEFCGADLGDSRRSRRLVKVAAQLARNPRGSLHGSLSNWADLLAGYRLLTSDSVTLESATAVHRGQVLKACGESSDVLLIEDTTSLNYNSLKATESLGWIGDKNCRGLYLHTTMALGIAGWNEKQEPQTTALGLMAIKCWARPKPDVARRTESKESRLKRDRESARWAAVFATIGGPPKGSRWTYVADRESDIYEVFERCELKRVDWIVRACQPRALNAEDGSIFEAVSAGKRLGTYALKLRARPGEKKRKAKLEVRARTVTLKGTWRPGTRLTPVTLNVVEAREVNPPEGVEAIRWVILTTWPVDDFKAALRVLKAYTKRWLIEEYHKALKTGAGAEESQLMQARSLMALIGILAVIAVRLLNLKLLVQSRPDERIECDGIDPLALQLLAKTRGRPKGGWTNKTVLIAIASLGGFLGRKSDGNPGWLMIWQGWYRLTIMLQGIRLLQGG